MAGAAVWHTSGRANIPSSSSLRASGHGVAARPPATDSATVAPITPGCPGERRNLVVLELSGGNDGLATVVPYGDGRINDLRPSIGIAAEDLVILNNEVGLHPSLQTLNEQGLAVVQGVGTPNPNGSHFEMERRWWAGDPEGSARLGTGFLGRLCDELNEGAPITGLTIGTGASPIMYAATAGTVAFTDPDTGWYLLNDDPWYKNLRMGLGQMAQPADGFDAARTGLSSALEFGSVLEDFQNEDEADDRPEYPYADIRDQFMFAADVLGADAGVRVIHIKLGGFDTHGDQRGDHGYLWEQINNTLVPFRQDLERLGLADDTLIATVSEFGRRPAQNGSGTDHGAASMAMLCGPVHNGLHGEAPSLAKLDGDDNLRATVRMDEYYATLADWMGVDHRTVLPTNASPIEGLLLPCKTSVSIRSG